MHNLFLFPSSTCLLYCGELQVTVGHIRGEQGGGVGAKKPVSSLQVPVGREKSEGKPLAPLRDDPRTNTLSVWKMDMLAFLHVDSFNLEVFLTETMINSTFLSFAGRNRWVIYNEKHNHEYDGSMIPAEWFGWMHYKTDTPPTVVSDE